MIEMKEISSGTWASVSWPCVSDFPTIPCDSDSGGGSAGQFKNSTTYQFILEFNKMSFAEDVLTHLSNLLDTQSMADVPFVVKNEKIEISY